MEVILLWFRMIFLSKKHPLELVSFLDWLFLWIRICGFSPQLDQGLTLYAQQFPFHHKKKRLQMNIKILKSKGAFDNV